MCPGTRTRIGLMLMAFSKEANSTLPSTQLICADCRASSNVRTRWVKTTLDDRLLLLMELYLNPLFCKTYHKAYTCLSTIFGSLLWYPQKRLTIRESSASRSTWLMLGLSSLT